MVTSTNGVVYVCMHVYYWTSTNGAVGHPTLSEHTIGRGSIKGKVKQATPLKGSPSKATLASSEWYPQVGTKRNVHEVEE
eukprot:CAMPEP_0174701570 /NCGR_PEP_ID=MMETSP1094-20130205/6166_1 /TAXON_ID=156173 /ORGANISM="Chrysochromulina brevifilum, Strain UTEX LB 985" /LENGTH=79 /DNA_ID=CAMNT_0015899237 /DNA_START=627 /DNA_END=866 /DNA_ORIENTATION=-